MINWENIRYFRESEFACSHTGLCEVEPQLVIMVDQLRHEYGRPLILTSAYRHSSHPLEASKLKPGSHAQGKAVDIKAPYGAIKYAISKIAFDMGFDGIGVAGNFIHLDIGHDHAARPAMWTY